MRSNSLKFFKQILQLLKKLFFHFWQLNHSLHYCFWPFFFLCHWFFKPLSHSEQINNLHFLWFIHHLKNFSTSLKFDVSMNILICHKILLNPSKNDLRFSLLKDQFYSNLDFSETYYYTLSICCFPIYMPSLLNLKS